MPSDDWTWGKSGSTSAACSSCSAATGEPAALGLHDAQVEVGPGERRLHPALEAPGRSARGSAASGRGLDHRQRRGAALGLRLRGAGHLAGQLLARGLRPLGGDALGLRRSGWRPPRLPRLPERLAELVVDRPELLRGGPLPAPPAPAPAAARPRPRPAGRRPAGRGRGSRGCAPAAAPAGRDLEGGQRLLGPLRARRAPSPARGSPAGPAARASAPPGTPGSPPPARPSPSPPRSRCRGSSARGARAGPACSAARSSRPRALVLAESRGRCGR